MFSIFAFSLFEILLDFAEAFICCSHILDKVATKKQTLDILLYLSFKTELPTNCL